MWIAWNYQDTDFTWPLTFEQKVNLFYEQALGWQLHIADLVANGGTAFGEGGQRDGKVVSSIRHSGLAVLQICLSYFETIGRYTGQRFGSEDAFCQGVYQVFPNLPTDNAEVAKAVHSLYRDARCGLYHNPRTARLGLRPMPESEAIVYDCTNQLVMVCPEHLPRVLKDHLNRFRDALLDERNVKLRVAFERQFDKDSGINKK